MKFSEWNVLTKFFSIEFFWLKVFDGNIFSERFHVKFVEWNLLSTFFWVKLLWLNNTVVAVVTKTLQESQNAALRTSHWLSNESNCSFQKYWERFFNRVDSSDSSEKVHATSPHKYFATYFFTCSVLLESAIWHIWQPMWCYQGSVLQLSRWFWKSYVWESDRWHVTHEIWQVTCDIWHMKPDTWHLTQFKFVFLFRFLCVFFSHVCWVLFDSTHRLGQS